MGMNRWFWIFQCKQDDDILHLCCCCCLQSMFSSMTWCDRCFFILPFVWTGKLVRLKLLLTRSLNCWTVVRDLFNLPSIGSFSACFFFPAFQLLDKIASIRFASLPFDATAYVFLWSWNSLTKCFFSVFLFGLCCFRIRSVQFFSVFRS